MSEHPPVAKRGHRNDIQGLRAVAVLLVALSHAGVSFLAGGFVGVDVFFVLSGFLITGLLLTGASRGRSGIVDFYGRRARRILPAASLTLIVTDLAANRLLNFVRVKEIMQASFSATFFTANIHFANQGTNYFAKSQPPSPIQQFWSLAVEEQFYIVWPIILFVALAVALGARRRHGARPRLRLRLRRLGVISRTRSPEITPRAMHVALVVVLAIAASSLAWSLHDTTAHPSAAYFSTLTRAWELALGALLAIAAPKLLRIGEVPWVIAGWIGLGAIIAAGVVFSSSTKYPGYAALLPTLGAALVIAAGITGSRSRLAVGRVLAVAPMRYVGDRSYAFYLWHWPALTIAALYIGHTLAVGSNLALLAVAFLVSIVSYRFVENPIRRMSWPSPASALALWPIAIVATTLVAGFILISTENKETKVAVAALRPEAGLVSAQQLATEDAKSAKAVELDVAATNAGVALPAVKASAESARHGGQIPSGLSPPPGALVNDHYTFPAGCAPVEGETTSKVCRLGDASGTKSIVLLGDSHAQMWMPALLNEAQREHWVVLPLVHSGCTPPAWTSSLGSAECHTWYKWAVRQAMAQHPYIMLMAGAYSGDGAEGRTATVDAFGSLSKAMKPYARHVVVISDPPGETRNPVDCLLSENATMGDCTSSETAAQSATDSELAAIAKADGAGLMETTGWFCFEGRCPSVIGRTIAYSDAGHVSKTYALELAHPFAAALRRASTSKTA